MIWWGGGGGTPDRAPVCITECVLSIGSIYYIFRDGDLNQFRDIRRFINWLGLGMPPNQSLSPEL